MCIEHWREAWYEGCGHEEPKYRRLLWTDKCKFYLQSREASTFKKTQEAWELHKEVSDDEVDEKIRE